MEFPDNPSKRELERQQAISTIISGMAYKAVDMHIDVDYVPPADPPEWAQEEAPIQGMQDIALRLPGFNWETLVEYTREI